MTDFTFYQRLSFYCHHPFMLSNGCFGSLSCWKTHDWVFEHLVGNNIVECLNPGSILQPCSMMDPPPRRIDWRVFFFFSCSLHCAVCKQHCQKVFLFFFICPQNTQKEVCPGTPWQRLITHFYVFVFVTVSPLAFGHKPQCYRLKPWAQTIPGWPSSLWMFEMLFYPPFAPKVHVLDNSWWHYALLI